MLSSVNPLSLLAACLVWLVAAIAIFDPGFQLATILVMVAALLLFRRLSPLAILALMVPFALFGFGMLTTALLFRQDGLFPTHVAVAPPVAPHAVYAGVTLFLRTVACGMISALFAFSVDPGALVRALMAWCRLPARVGHALFAAMQLVPDLAGELQQMRLARAMKSGARLRRIPGPREALSLLIPLLAYAIRRAGRIAIAMEARGLSPGPRTIMHVPPFTRRDAAFALAAAGLILLSSLPALLALPLSP
jgi:energy-coupling factor transport system permease protein